MEITFDNYSIAPIKEKDAWRICDFVVANEKRLKDFFPLTVKANLTPTLAELFTKEKEKQFEGKDEYLFTVKENTNRTIIGLVFIKELHRKAGQGELVYCLSYQYEGRGLMSQIASYIIQWAFDIAELETLQAIIHESNLGSRKVVKKNQFEYITTLQKEHQMSDGSIADMLLYELQKSNFNLNP